ncbi:MAG: STAS domain-containing protein [Polyangiaceae bacterium]|nr:STAS domain-containing protein [Polyangiaceae bacterium]
MRCEQCLLEAPGSADLPLDEFLDRLSACDECPLVHGEGASAPLRLLAKKQLEAARALRKLNSRARKHEIELHDLMASVEKYEARMADLESLHKASTKELEAQLNLVQSQQQAIRALSTPLIQVADGVLALPIIGSLDASRTAVLTEALLDEVRASGARYVILDLTGLLSVETDTGALLLRVFGAVRLLGAKVLLAGMKSEIALAFVTLGADLSTIMTVRSMKDALRLCGAGGLRTI